MPKEKTSKKSMQLRHAPLGSEMDRPTGKLKVPKKVDPRGKLSDDEDEIGEAEEKLPKSLGTKIIGQARDQLVEMKEVKGAHTRQVFKDQTMKGSNSDSEGFETDSDADDGEFGDELDDNMAPMVSFEGEYVHGAELSDAEEAVVQHFLNAGRTETRTLADIIMEKIREREEDVGAMSESASVTQGGNIPPKVAEVYSSVGKMLAHYKSGKLPKALKMLPHLRSWEDVLWLTRPDEWSPAATYACTRIFASNLNEKMAQRFYNLVLLEKCRDDIRTHDKLNYHLYMALKKALFKPAAFYKGLLLPLAQSRTCTLREATIVGSVLTKVSIPSNHSAAALLRLAEMPYSGSTSLFIRVLLNKKYALPRRVVDALVNHFAAFEQETRVLPVVWHQAFLVFVQRYKFELDEAQRDRLKALARAQHHHQIAIEIRRELGAAASAAAGRGLGQASLADDNSVAMKG